MTSPATRPPNSAQKRKCGGPRVALWNRFDLLHASVTVFCRLLHGHNLHLFAILLYSTPSLQPPDSNRFVHSSESLLLTALLKEISNAPHLPPSRSHPLSPAAHTYNLTPYWVIESKFRSALYISIQTFKWRNVRRVLHFLSLTSKNSTAPQKKNAQYLSFHQYLNILRFLFLKFLEIMNFV